MKKSISLFRSCSIVLLIWVSGSVWAAGDPVRGRALYLGNQWNKPCSDCHGVNVAANQSNIKRGANDPALIASAVNRNVGGMGQYYSGKIGATDYDDLAAFIANPNATGTPVASLSLTTVNFGSVILGATSAAQLLTLNNTGSAPLNVGSVSRTGAQAGEFTSTGTGACSATGGSLAAGASCTITLEFRPTTAGSRSATLQITHNAAGGSSSATLSGTGAIAPTPVLSLSATALDFNSPGVAVGQSQTKTITVRNTGGAALNLTGATPIILSGTNANAYTVAGSCTQTTSVAPTGSCTIDVSFAPSALGEAPAFVELSSNATAAPQKIALNGLGVRVASAQIFVSPVALNFGDQTVNVVGATQIITVGNSGNAALSIDALSLTGAQAAQFAIVSGAANHCTAGASLGAGASCTVEIRFSPTAVGTAAATLDLSSNSSPGPTSVGVQGNGVNTPTAIPVLAPSDALTFTDPITVAQASGETVTSLSNSGAAALTISAIGNTGANAADFILAQPAAAGDCAVGISLASNESCRLRVLFSPRAAGARFARVEIITATGAKLGRDYHGTGAALVPAAFALDQNSLDFATVSFGSASPAKSIKLSNDGGSTLNITRVQVTGPNANSFRLEPVAPCALGAVVQLAPAQSCSIRVTYTPTTINTDRATIEFSTDTALAAGTVALIGKAVMPPTTQAVPGTDGGGAASASAAADAPNAGFGGCTAARGGDDPLLPALALAAAAVLLYRHRNRRIERR